MNSIYFKIFVSPGQQAQALNTGTSLIENSSVQISAPANSSNRVSSKEHLLLSLEQASIRALQKHDREGWQPVQAALANASNPEHTVTTYAMKIGPDGQRYAIGGELQVDISPGHTPEKTQVMARLKQATAKIPTDTLNQDHNVATQAQVLEAQANTEINQRSRQSQRLVNQYQSSMETSPNNTWDAQA